MLVSITFMTININIVTSQWVLWLQVSMLSVWTSAAEMFVELSEALVLMPVFAAGILEGLLSIWQL